MSESTAESQRSGSHRDDAEWLERLEQVDRPVASTVRKVMRDLRDLASAAEDEAVGQLLASTARLDGETTQKGILSALLEEGRRFASRTAFFLTRREEVRGWAGRGFASVEGTQFDYSEGGIWERMAKQTGASRLGAEECAAICLGLDAPTASEGVLIPFALRGQLAGVLYADRLDGEGPLAAASLQLLTHSASQSLETAALRGGVSSPALRFSSQTASEDESIALWQPAAAAAAAVGGAAAAAAPAEAAVEEPVEKAEAPVAEEPAAEATAESEVEAVEPEPEVEAVEPEPVVEAVAEVEATTEDSPAEAVDFEMVSATEAEEEMEAVDDISAELEPEPELEDTSDLWAEDEDSTAVTAAPEPAAAPPEVGQETVRLDIASLQDQTPVPDVDAVSEEETAKVPQWEVEPLPEPSAPDFELEADESAESADEAVTAAMSAPDFADDATEDATIITPSPMAGGYVPPAPEPTTEVTPPPDMMPSAEVTPPAPEPSTEVTPPPSSGFASPPPAKADATGTQVVPPTDIQGPGSAFGATDNAIPEGEEALHEEARRLARLLVSEIKLYNEEIIEEGRRSGNIYDRLKDDIDRSRQMYEERIDPRLLESGNDYFRQELVQRLAGGDERLLGY